MISIMFLHENYRYAGYCAPSFWLLTHFMKHYFHEQIDRNKDTTRGNFEFQFNCSNSPYNQHIPFVYDISYTIHTHLREYFYYYEQTRWINQNFNFAFIKVFNSKLFSILQLQAFCILISFSLINFRCR